MFTTTSLYGKTKEIPLSQYDRLKYWKKWVGQQVVYHMSHYYQLENDTGLVDENHTYKYFEWYVAKKDTGQPHKETIE